MEFPHPYSDTLVCRYANFVAADDFVWVVDGTICDIHNLIIDPLRWVRKLPGIRDWQKISSPGAPTPKLLKSFTICFSEIKMRRPRKEVVFQGISGTGIINVHILRTGDTLPLLKGTKFEQDYMESAEEDENSDRVINEWKYGLSSPYVYGKFTEFLRDGMCDKALRVDGIVDRDSGRFLLHKKVLDETCDPAARARHLACYLIGTTLHPRAYITLLNGAGPKMTSIPKELGDLTPVSLVYLRHPGDPALPIPPILPIPFIGEERDLDTQGQDQATVSVTYASSAGSTAEVCDAATGNADEPDPAADQALTGALTTITTKDYSGG